MKKNRLKVVGYFLDMFWVNKNDGVKGFINSCKILICCCFLNSFMKQSRGGLNIMYHKKTKSALSEK